MEAALQAFAVLLRHQGLRVSTAEVVDAASCAAQPGMLTNRDRLRAALRASLVTRPADLRTFDEAFDFFFSLSTLPQAAASVAAAGVGEGGETTGADDLEDLSLIDGTQGAGQIDSGSAGERDMREFFDPDVLRDGTNLDDDADIADLSAMTDEVSFSPSGASSQGKGMKVQLDVNRSRGVEDPGALTPATGEAIDLALSETEEEQLLTWLGAAGAAPTDPDADAEDAAVRGLLERLPEHLTEHLRRLSGLRRTERAVREASPALLDDVSAAERDRLEESLRRMAQSLQGGLSQRRRPHPRGRVDPARTARTSMRFDGIPFTPVRVRQTRERPRVLVLADVSLSVRATSRFTLHVVHQMQSRFGQVRSFVFVDDVVEVTELFESHPLEHALGLVFSGDVLDPDASSDYGAVFTGLLEGFGRAVDRRTSVIVLGDGRSNGKDPGLEAFAEIARRARRTVWLSPEPTRSWGLGACAMADYAPLCDHVQVVRDLTGLERTSHRIEAAR